jgi:glycosyltransferase involved in cell wall biosynthesis
MKIEIILPKSKPISPIKRNWNVTRIFLSHFPPQFFNFLIIPYLFLINKSRKIDVIRLHQPQFTGFAAIFFKFFDKNIKIIATYHQFQETNFWIFSKIINNYWDHIICDSERVKQKIIKQYQVPAKKVSVVHNGIPSYLKPAIKDKKLLRQLNLENQFVMLFMGFFIKRKNPLFLLDVISKIKEKHNNIVLIFWGTGPQKDAIIKKAETFGLRGNIRIQNPIFGPGKNLIHNLADIFVLPSIDEGFALAPLEAMACAKPVIMNKSHSALEAVSDNLNGYLCKINDENDWVEKLNKLIVDVRLRIKMGKASLDKTIKEFQWQKSVDKHLQVLKSLRL